MKFPNIGDIATTSVVSIDIKSTFNETINMMLNNEHRNIIVTDNNDFYIMSIIDILNVQEKKVDVNTPLSELNLLKIPVINKEKNILDTVEYLNNSTEHICVINNDGTLYDNVVVVEDLKPVGIFTTKDIMELVKNKTDLDVDIEQHMSSPVDSIHKNASIREALSFIKDRHYKRVVVVDDDGLLSGIITQKELISLTYSKWAILMKEYQDELSEINLKLHNKNIEYENIASTDSLTGLYNRHKFSQLYLSSYTSMIQRHNDMSIIILDIDYFKKVNDVYGHNAGDKTLVQVSHTLLKILRNIDVVCRWGGEEFLIMLPTADLKHAISIAEKLRKAIEDLSIDIVGQVTASFGVSQVREGEDMQDVIDRADKALYLAKDFGRNCVKSEADI
ncbi:diguanylate cyclase [Sulfurimonas sp. CS5]|uniref:diguanylate cyclase n=1 Tax=Sulfurimonas sp. CS5 TaxID=3391145 RepID=UPI0039E837D9